MKLFLERQKKNVLYQGIPTIRGIVLSKTVLSVDPQYFISRRRQLDFSPVHVVLVSLLVGQLSGLFLIFFGRPKKRLSSLREFLVSLCEFLVDQVSFWYTKFFFGQPNFFLVDQKFPETDQKFPETGQFFFG